MLKIKSLESIGILFAIAAYLSFSLLDVILLRIVIGKKIISLRENDDELFFK